MYSLFDCSAPFFHPVWDKIRDFLHVTSPQYEVDLIGYQEE